MSSNELSTEISPEIINSLILTGDMSKLTPAQQTQYYGAVCKDLGLNPLTQPFAIIVLQNKKTLYATKGCTQQLCNIRKINTEVKSRELKDSVYIVTVRATLPDGRMTDEDGVVSIVGMKGTDLANAMMKATTKAKRRAVLALCGLGMSDESEVEDIRGARTEPIKPLIVNDTEEAIIADKKPLVVENPVKEDKIEETPLKEPKKTAKKPKEEPKPAETKDTLTVIGLIDNEVQGPEGEIICTKISSQPVLNPYTKKEDIKYSFLLGSEPNGKRYGTWDTQLAKQIMECIDNRRMVKIEYKERKNEKGTMFYDIVSFKEATIDEVKEARI